MPKLKRHPGTVGVYLLRHGDHDNWETLVHRRSERVNNAQYCIATPGGFVNKGDCVDDQRTMNMELGYYNAMFREIYEKTRFELDSIDPANIEKLDPLPIHSSTHRNFLIYFNAKLTYAKPLANNKWEIKKGY